jgi:hypothetical protein
MEIIGQQAGGEVDTRTPEQVAEDLRISILDALGSTLSSKRHDAVSAKTSSGIETTWQGDEEFYAGYDDANRGEFTNTALKPAASDGSAAPKKKRGSTVFPNITQPYVDAAAARVGDMLLPTDDRNFAIEPTPIPDMFASLEGAIRANQPKPAAAPIPAPNAQAQGMGIPGMPGAQPAAAQPEPMVQMPDGAVMAVSAAKERFNAMKQEAARKAELAQTQIEDWLTECQYHAEMRKVIDDSARLGSGVIKGPVPVKRRAQKWEKDAATGVYKMTIIDEIKPASMRVDPWDIFPDPACGESIHRGDFVFERDRLTRKCLEDLIDVPGYIKSAIQQCLTEGPQRALEADPRNLANDAQSRRTQYEIWYYHGFVTADELRAIGVGDIDNKVPGVSTIPVMITMVNNHVIKAALNPMDDGQFPYDVIPWKRMPGMPWGMGVARQMRTPQRMVVAATRNLMDNAGMAAGPQFVLRNGTSPADGILEIVPLKFWNQDEDTPPGAGSPLEAVVIPMLEASLMTIIQFGMKMAEDVTGLPQLLQGQQGTAPDTVGGLTILNNNANSVLRRIARLFDSSITEPHIRRYYGWLMQYGENDDAKGDFQILARGSTALVERDIQGQELVQLVQMSLNPAFGLNPEKAAEEYLKSRRFDPAAFQYSDEEKEEMAKRPAPEDPRIAAEKMRIEAAANQLQMKQQFDAEQADKDREFQKFMTQLNADIDAQLDERAQAGDHAISLEDIKAMLAATTMKLQTQKELSYVAAGRQAVTPPTEPAGRATAGRAYEQ